MLTYELDERPWLRLLEEPDAEELYAVVDANRSYLGRWMPWAQDDDLENVQDFIRMSRRQLADNDGFSRKVPSPTLTAAEAQRRGRAGFAVLGAGVTMLGVTVRMGESNPPGAALAPPEGRFPGVQLPGSCRPDVRRLLCG